MKLAAARDLKKEILGKFARERAGRVTASAQNLATQPAEARLAVGYTQIAKEDYQLEIRVQRRSGWAYATAEDYRQKAQGQANIEVVERVEIPPRTVLDNLERPSWLQPPQRRPLHLGLPVGNANDGSGTLGLFVETSDGNRMILSCNHVLAILNEAKTGPKGDKIFQPGPAEEMPKATNAIAQVYDYVELTRPRRNTLDAAIAELFEEVEDAGNTIPRGYGFPREGDTLGTPMTPDELTALGRGARVAKIGRSTGHTTGEVTAVALDGLPVFTGGLGNLIFDDVIEIAWADSDSPFSLPGDSGSVIFLEKDLRPLGLLFAGSRENSKTYACSLYQALVEFQVEML